MEYLFLLIINIVGTMFITSLEKNRDVKRINYNVMGIWPYNIVMLSGFLVLIVKDITNSIPINVIIVVALITLVFYAVKYVRIKNTSLE